MHRRAGGSAPLAFEPACVSLLTRLAQIVRARRAAAAPPPPAGAPPISRQAPSVARQQTEPMFCTLRGRDYTSEPMAMSGRSLRTAPSASFNAVTQLGRVPHVAAGDGWSTGGGGGAAAAPTASPFGAPPPVPLQRQHTGALPAGPAPLPLQRAASFGGGRALGASPPQGGLGLGLPVSARMTQHIRRSQAGMQNATLSNTPRW